MDFLLGTALLVLPKGNLPLLAGIGAIKGTEALVKRMRDCRRRRRSADSTAQLSVAKEDGVEAALLMWQNVMCELTTRAGEKNLLLKRLSGAARPERCSVPQSNCATGSSKTTQFNTPAGQLSQSKHITLQGAVEANIALVSDDRHKQAFVDQSNELLTPSETLETRCLLPEVASAVIQAKPQQVVDRSVLEAVTGTWTKDFKRSSSMESFFELFKVPSIVRRAAILIRGMSIVMDDTNLSVTMLCALPWFNVTETYPLSGAPGQAKRRDMQSGKQLGRVETQPDGSIKLKLSWDDPMAGSSMDGLRLTDGGQELHVLCRASVGEGRARFEAVYRRKPVGTKGREGAAAAGGGRARGGHMLAMSVAGH